MANPQPLQPGAYYHVYNRGSNGADLFLEDRNYRFFLQLYARHIEPVATTYAYCLLRNHFHLLIRTRTQDEIAQSAAANHDPQAVSSPAQAGHRAPSQAFSNLFNGYARAFNRAYGRTGALFERPFGRVLVTTHKQLCHIVTYIHHNPQKHGFVDDFREWPWTSFSAYFLDRPTRLARDQVLDWSGGRDAFAAAHRAMVPDYLIVPLVPDDFA